MKANSGIVWAVIGMSVVMLSSGCATITRGSKDTLVVNSSPSGAEVKLSNGMTGETPATFKLPRKENVVVDITKAGYEPVKVNVMSQISGAGGAGMAGNVLVGGIIGAAVDAGSGAMNDLVPNPVNVTLTRASDALGPGPADTRLRALNSMRRTGLISEGEYREKRREIMREM